MQTLSPAQRACELRPVAVSHAGEILTFRGRYSSDGRERARIDVENCTHRYGVKTFADGVEREMDPNALIGFYPRRTIDAVFRARIDLVPPSTASYQDDDGVRLVILEVNDIMPVPD